MHNTKDCSRYKKDRTEKSTFHVAKKGRKKPNLIKQSFAQLSERWTSSAKREKHCRSNSDSNSELEIGLGSIEKAVVNLGETLRKPSLLLKATFNRIASNNIDVCSISGSNADDITVTSSSQKESYMLITVLPLVKTLKRAKLLQ
jgi:hypothetical protein